jgi:drug/metabolite transporter (DMT)-like permease
MGIFLVFFLFSIWSVVFPLGKYALLYSSPIFITGARMTFAGILLLAYLYFRKKLPPLSGKQLFSLFLLALFSIYITNILEFWGLAHLSAAKTCFLYSLTPFVAALLSYIHFKEKMTPGKWIGMLIGSLGFIPVLLDKSGTESLFDTIFFFSLPELAVFGAVFFSTYGWILLRLVVKDNKISPPVANGISMFIGGALALFTSFFTDSWNPLPFDSSATFPLLGTLLVITLISNILCYNLYGYLLKKYTATFLSFFGLLSPLFASFHSWILIGEPPSLPILLSSPIVILGLFLIHREELRQGYISSNTLTKSTS